MWSAFELILSRSISVKQLRASKALCAVSVDKEYVVSSNTMEIMEVSTCHLFPLETPLIPRRYLLFFSALEVSKTTPKRRRRLSSEGEDSWLTRGWLSSGGIEVIGFPGSLQLGMCALSSTSHLYRRFIMFLHLLTSCKPNNWPLKQVYVKFSLIR